MLKNEGGNGDIHLQIPKAEEGFGKPEKIICVGVNYPDRNEEYKDGQNIPSNMSLFVRFARSFVGHNCPIIRPKTTLSKWSIRT